MTIWEGAVLKMLRVAIPALMVSPPRRAGAAPGRSYEPLMAILLFSCTLALHARQVDIRLRLDYLWAAQARQASWG